MADNSAPTLSAARKKFSEITEALYVAARHNLNVLMRGERGVGKTMLAHQVVYDDKLRMKYFSTSTLDPFADLIGIPVPKTVIDERGEDKTVIKYCRAEDINQAEFMFFDELNRSHKRVRNAVLEIIQFKALNGERLEHLRMAWAAINPSDSEDYETEKLDEALMDRFHYQIDVPYDMNPLYFDQKYGSRKLTEEVFNWWHNLTDELRSKCSPRRVEIIVDSMYKGIDFRWINPLDHPLPLQELHLAIENLLGKIDLSRIKGNQEHFIELLRSKEIHNAEFVDTCKILMTLDARQIAELADVVLAMPEDYVANLVHRGRKFEDLRKYLFQVCPDQKTFQDYVMKFQSIAAVAPKRPDGE